MIEGLLSRRQASARREQAREAGTVVVFTNGCFDLLHAGHVRYLAAARSLGELLIVGLNDDDSVRRLKGKERPLVPLEERAELLLGLESVDLVVPFAEDTPAELVSALVPDILAKGADWAPDRIVGRETVEAAGGRVELIPLVEGTSTSDIVRRILERHGRDGRS
jgi:D-beta-D-heptose 7-phosphate kinase/D-beta-D-heptose 1-phosphate adenosyltransferase